MNSTPSSRRRRLVIRAGGAVVLAAALAWFGSSLANRQKSTVKAAAPVAIPESPPRTVTSDPIKIFQRAFWRSPGENDRILHGERRDWAGDDGLAKWQWFIVVQPSPELVKYLRDDNAFGLVSGMSAPKIEGSPTWFNFKPSDVDVLQAPRAKLILLFSKTENLLYATDSGDGFRPGAPEAQVASQKSPTSTGRLPATPPPSSR